MDLYHPSIEALSKTPLSPKFIEFILEPKKWPKLFREYYQVADEACGLNTYNFDHQAKCAVALFGNDMDQITAVEGSDGSWVYCHFREEILDDSIWFWVTEFGLKSWLLLLVFENEFDRDDKEDKKQAQALADALDYPPEAFEELFKDVTENASRAFESLVAKYEKLAVGLVSEETVNEVKDE